LNGNIIPFVKTSVVQWSGQLTQKLAALKTRLFFGEVPQKADLACIKQLTY